MFSQVPVEHSIQFDIDFHVESVGLLPAREASGFAPLHAFCVALELFFRDKKCVRSIKSHTHSPTEYRPNRPERIS